MRSRADVNRSFSVRKEYKNVRKGNQKALISTQDGTAVDPVLPQSYLGLLVLLSRCAPCPVCVAPTRGLKEGWHTRAYLAFHCQTKRITKVKKYVQLLCWLEPERRCTAVVPSRSSQRCVLVLLYVYLG